MLFFLILEKLLFLYRYQKCFDFDCRGFQSNDFPIPSEVLPPAAERRRRKTMLYPISKLEAIKQRTVKDDSRYAAEELSQPPSNDSDFDLILNEHYQRQNDLKRCTN
jgi:hypothetical protein